MKTKFTTLASAAFLSAALAGCGHSEIDAVKAATVPQDSTHTYETAISNRASCEKDSWHTFKDDTNRTVVEYRCELKNGAALLSAFRQQKISDAQRDFQGYYHGLDQTTKSIESPERLEKQLADAQSQLAQLQANDAPSGADIPKDPQALKQGIVNSASAMEVAQSAVERAQRELDDARNNQTGVQQERSRFEQQEKETLAQIDKTYGGITQASEIFQWHVRDDEAVPAWSGVELVKQDRSTTQLNRDWQKTMKDLLSHRGDDHVHYALDVPDNIASGQQPSASQ
ncbi:hypothetical protein [Paraburkholderia fynbosensis]|uniref:Lipoprotein n=1 Tax=Paraburkholderia fynbosensis TaxID=1200993 RepID=A0A6J5G3S9_9BURK|nr:hypothetical protein [Paraburkholderia fynbosensis]CAB3790928.1 hypothetical protein LMG27177_02949 [Paraburkholderia fynbosensis]